MYAWVRHLAALAVLGVLFSSKPALAWVETRTLGHAATIELGRDGIATISHELTLGIRGGPVRSLELAIADAGAEILPDARVTKTTGGPPLPLIIEQRPDGTLALEVDHERGLKTGQYVFVVRYRTNLLARDRLVRDASSVRVHWIGPRLPGGVDGVRTVFRVPAGRVAPSFSPADPDEPDPTFGVLVAGIRRTAEYDEIELVRAHVADGEPVPWRVDVSAESFSAFSAVAPSANAADKVAPPTLTASVTSRSLQLPSVALGLFFALLVFLKQRAVFRLATDAGARARALLPIPGRPLLAGALFGGALYVGAELEEPTFAGVLLLGAIAFAALRAPVFGRELRGPGRWLPLRDEDAFTEKPQVSGGSWLDAGSRRGLLVLATLLLAALALSFRELSRSPYRALLELLLASGTLPVFFTGLASDFSRDRVGSSRKFLRRLSEGLKADAALGKVVAWARVPEGRAEPDELRVLSLPKRALSGLIALEAGVELERGLGGRVLLPFVIVRAKEGSPAHAVLLSGVSWSRGRKPEERVAILRPRLPTLALTLRLLARLSALLSETKADQGSRSARSSSGSSALTSKLGSVPSPAHAT
jgi:hypothetical protein